MLTWRAVVGEPRPVVPEELEDYAWIESIGAGGSGQVWKARPRAADGPVDTLAIKILTITGTAPGDRERFRAAFRREAKIALDLSDGPFIPVTRYFETETHCYLVMKFIDGVDLDRYRRHMAATSRRIPIPVIVHIIWQVAIGLHMAHTMRHGDGPAGVIHRDLTPRNIMLSAGGNIWILDFGLARLLKDVTDGRPMLGTQLYIAPEQAHGMPGAPPADMFQVGAILHELLAGRPLRDENRVLTQITHHEIAPVTREGVPPALLDLRDRLLDRDPDARPNAAEVVRVCETIGAIGGHDTVAKHVCEMLGILGPRAPSTSVPQMAAIPSPAEPTGPDSPAGEQARTDPEPAAAPEVVEAATGRRSLVATAGLILGVATVSGGGVYMALRSEPAARPAAVPGPAAKPAAVPVPVPVPVPEPKSEPPPPPKPTPEPEATPEIEPTETPTTKKKPRPVPVKLHLGDIRLAYVRIDGKQHVLEPWVDLKLTPGKHQLRWRELPHHPWKRATITIKPGRPNKVRFDKTGPQRTQP